MGLVELAHRLCEAATQDRRPGQSTSWQRRWTLPARSCEPDRVVPWCFLDRLRALLLWERVREVCPAGPRTKKPHAANRAGLESASFSGGAPCANRASPNADADLWSAICHRKTMSATVICRACFAASSYTPPPDQPALACSRPASEPLPPGCAGTRTTTARPLGAFLAGHR